MIRRRIATAFLACLAVPSAGCNLLTPLVFMHPGTKEVPPEYDRLKSTRTVVLIWAESATLYDYPYIRLELAAYLGDELRANVDNIQVINARKVEDYIQRHPLDAVDPRAVGNQFDAERVVYIELLEFQLRDPMAPDLLQGRLRAAVSVHDMTALPGDVSIQDLEEVTVLYPERAVLRTSTAPLTIRNQTYIQFAQKVGRKFYPHQEEL